MPLKDDPACYNASYGIKEWDCDGPAEGVYDSQGGLTGYRGLCPTCWDVRAQEFEYPCHDSHCFGDQIIRLKGSQVAGHYRNMSEKSNWTFPPIRCEACREWLRNVEQAKKACDACGQIFVVGAGHFKYVKKHVGDPVVHSQRFCPRCDRLTEEERSTLVYKRNMVVGRYKEQSRRFRHAMRFRDAMLLIQSDISSELLAENELGSRDVVKMLRPTSIPPMGTKADIARYAVMKTGSRSKPGETRLEHIAAHMNGFRPPFNTVEEQLANADRVLANSNQDRVVNLVDARSGNNLKLEITTGTLVIYNSQGHVTNYEVCRSHHGEKNAYLSYVKAKIAKGHWAAPN